MADLRVTMFQQYLRLQMWLLSRVVWYAAWVYIGSLVCFALLRIFTGISIKRLGYLSLRHISVHPRQGVELRIGKLGIMPHRPTVARPGFLTFVVSNLEVIVDPETIIEHEEALARANPNQSGKSTPTEAAAEYVADVDAANEPEFDDSDGDNFLDAPDPTSRRNSTRSTRSARSTRSSRSARRNTGEDKAMDEEELRKGIRLLPTKNSKAFSIIRWLVTKVRVFNLNVQSISFVFNEVTTTVMTAANLRVDLRKTLNYQRSNFVGTLDSYKLADNELPVSVRVNITDVYTAESLEDESPWQAVEDMRLDVNGVLNLDTMSLKELGAQIHSGKVQLDATYILETLNKVIKIRASKAAKLRNVPPTVVLGELHAKPDLRQAQKEYETAHPGEPGGSDSPLASPTMSHGSSANALLEEPEPATPYGTEIPSGGAPAEGGHSAGSEADSTGGTSGAKRSERAVLGKRDRERILKGASLILHLVSRLQATIGVLEIVRLPVMHHKGTDENPKDVSVMMAAGMKDLNLDISRMNSKGSGFRLMYDEDDLAHQLLFVLASLNIGFDNGDQQEEVLYVPLVTGLNRGNVFSQTLKYIKSNDPNKVNKSHWRSRWAVNAPTISIGQHQIPDIVKVFMGLGQKSKQKRAANHNGSAGSAHSSGSGAEPVAPDALSALPNLDLEIVISDSTMRTLCEPTKSYQNAMFVTSADRIMIVLEGTHRVIEHRHSADEHGYNALARFTTAGGKTWYHSSNLPFFDLGSTKETLLEVKAATKPKLEVQVRGVQDKFHVTCLRHEIFAAIGQLHAALRNPARQWHARHPGHRVVHDDTTPVHRGSALRGVPVFLTKVDFHFTDFSVTLASNHFRGKTNDILGNQFVTRDLRVRYSASDKAPENVELKSRSDGRHLSVTGTDFVLYKADKDLLDNERFDSKIGETEQLAVAHLPKLGLEVWTSKECHSFVDVRIEPRLKIALNINLILAFSVLRENVNVALLRHHKPENESMCSDDPYSRRNSAVAEPAPQPGVKSARIDPSDEPQLQPSVRAPVEAKEINHINVELPRVLIKVDMPSDDQLMIELNQAKLDFVKGTNPVLHTKALRMYSKHPFQHEAWCILLSLIALKVEVNLVKKDIKDKILVNADGMRINVPYKFKLYRIIDNGITLAKAIKTLLLQTDKLDTMIALDPKKIQGVPNIPRVRVLTNQFMLSLEDDYFESDLTLIMLTNLEVAETRRRKMYMFDSRVKKMLKVGLKALDEGILDDPRIGQGRGNHHYFGSFGGKMSQLDDGVAEKVAQAAANFKKGASNMLEHGRNFTGDGKTAAEKEAELSNVKRHALDDEGVYEHPNHPHEIGNIADVKNGISGVHSDSNATKIKASHGHAANGHGHAANGVANGHASNDIASNGHASNGHAPNGHAANGHAANGAAKVANGSRQGTPSSTGYGHLKVNTHGAVHSPGAPKSPGSSKGERFGSPKSAHGSSKGSAVPDLPDENSVEAYHYRIAQALSTIPRDQIVALLHEGMELGSPADDHDEAFTNGHPWLDFWSSPRFARVRALNVVLSDGKPGVLTVSEARESLLEDFSRAWIDTMRHARMTQHYGARRKAHEKVSDKLDHDTCREEQIVDYSQKPLLMCVDMRQLDWTFGKTTHDTPEKLGKFLHDIGKGQPMDSEFSILIPLYIDLKAHDGMRIDIKDFPLPVLHFPGLSRTQDPNTNLALRIEGNLIITEQLMHTKKNIRRLFVPLRPLPKELREKRGSDVIEVHRTLTPIKTFTDLKFHAGSSLPTRVCWCMAYKAGFHSVGESFHGFSKPPIDPSPALGFWDKIRLVLHARFDFKFPKSPLCLTMKAGKSPYALLNSNSGFIFLWRDNVHVQINPDDEPKNLFRFESDRFELLVPNYMSWEAEFLNATPAERAFPRTIPLKKPQNAEKVVFSFNQRTVWQLGMKFEKGHSEKFFDTEKRLTSSIEVRDSDFRPHHGVELSMPEFIDNVEKYDAYRGFRSDFIYMSISVRSKYLEERTEVENAQEPTEDVETANSNACHLTMGVIQHFKAWKGQFSSEQWPPIRTGSLFPDPVRIRPSTKTFGTALSTSSYQIVLDTLDLSFFQPIADHRGAQTHQRGTGLKAKMEEFAFDWHTRREPPTIKNAQGDETNVELNGQRRWRMRSYQGQVRLRAVHLRALDVKLRTQSAKQALHALHEEDSATDDGEDEDQTTSDSDTSFEGQSTHRSASKYGASTSPFGVSESHPYGPRYLGKSHWVDLDDFSDIGTQRVLRSKIPDVKVLPFAYTPEFCFVRNTDFTDKAVYKDPKTGNRFPKFGEIDVQTYHVDVVQPANIQARLYETRLQHLRERLLDMKASLESLSSGAGGTSSQKKRIEELKGLLIVGRQNEEVLLKEIRDYKAFAGREDDRVKVHKARMKADLMETMKELDSHSRELAEATDKPDEFMRLVNDELPNFEAELTSFRNRYIIHAMHLKWNNSVRNLIYRLQYSISEDKELKYVRCRPAVQYLEELVSKAEEMVEEQQGIKPSTPLNKDSAKQASQEPGTVNVSDLFADSRLAGAPQETQADIRKRAQERFEEYKRASEKAKADQKAQEKRGPPKETGRPSGVDHVCSERLVKMFDDIRDVPDHQVARKAHFVYLPTPRIQLISEENPSKCLEMISKSVSVQVVDTYPRNSNFDAASSKIERRIGAMLDSAGFYVLGESDLDQAGIEALSLENYSGEEEDNAKLWPPWLAVELCYNPEPMKSFNVVKDMSFGIMLHKPNDLHVASGDEKQYQGKDMKALEEIELQNNSIEMREAIATEQAAAEQAAYLAAERAIEKYEREQREAELNGTAAPEFDTGLPKDGDTESKSKNACDDAGIDEQLQDTLKTHGQHKGKAILTSIVVDAPKVQIDMDSVQFYTVYTIATDLLTYRDPLIKKREQAINRVFLMSDFEGDYRLSLNTIELLQKDIRSLFAMTEQLQIHSARLMDMDRNAEVHLIKLRREVLVRQTRLIVLIRAFKASLRRNMNTGADKLTKWSLMADGIDMRLLNEMGQPMLEMLLRRAHFSKLSNDDEGSVNRATLGGISARNLLSESIYPQMLANYNTLNDKEFAEAVKLKWTRLERVGGIPVLQDAHAQLKPMHIQVEHGMFEKLLDFAFPITESKEEAKHDHDHGNVADDVVDYEDSEASDSNEDDDDDEATLHTTLSGGEEVKKASKSKKKKRGGLFGMLRPHHHKNQDKELTTNVDVDEMINRASNYWSIRSLVIHPTELVVSYKGKNHSVLNVQNLHVMFPGFEVANKTWTKLDLIMRLKKLAIKMLLSQSGSIIGNMFTRHKHHTIEDDRDVLLNSAPISDTMTALINQEVRDRDTLAAMSKQLQPHRNELPKSVEMVLIPNHRRLAIENPGRIKELTREATMNPSEIKRSYSSAANSKPQSAKNGQYKEDQPSGHHHHHTISLHRQRSGHEPQPGSPQQLRQASGQQQQQQQQQAARSAPKPTRNASYVSTAESTTSTTSSKPSKIFSKIRRGFN